MLKRKITISFLLVPACALFLSPACGNKARVKVNVKIEEPGHLQPATTTSTIDTTVLYPVNSMNRLEPVYNSTASYMWRNFVPTEGQAETVQGELIRCLEKLEYEISGNAKNNWNEQHVLLGRTLETYLLNSGVFPDNIQDEIKRDINLLIRKPDEVFTDDELYDRLTRRVVEWYWRHPAPVKHKRIKKLVI